MDVPVPRNGPKCFLGTNCPIWQDISIYFMLSLMLVGCVITWFVLLLVSACNNQGLHSLVGMDTDLTTQAPGFDSPFPPSQWRRVGIPSGVFFPTKIDIFSDSNEEIGIFIPNHPLPSTTSQWRRFDIPSGGFFPTKIATF